MTEGQALYLLEEATKLLRNEQNMLEVQGPITGEYAALHSVLLATRRCKMKECQLSSGTRRLSGPRHPVRRNEARGLQLFVSWLCTHHSMQPMG